MIKFHHSLYNSLSDTILVCENSGNIIFVNNAAKKLLGLSQSEPTEFDNKELFPLNFYEPFKKNLAAYLLPSSAKKNDVLPTISIPSKDGKNKEYEIMFSPIDDSKSNFIIAVLHEIKKDRNLKTEITKESSELIESQNFLDETQQIAKVGTYTIDIATGNWTASQQLKTILGIDSHFEMTYEGGQSIIHPDWREIMSNYFLEEVLTKKAKFDIEYKIIRPNDKQIRWVHGVGNLKYNANNEPVKFIAIVQDITESKNLENKLIESNEFNESLIRSMQDGLSIIDAKGIQTQVNESFCRMTGFSQDELIGCQSPFSYWPPEEYENINKALQFTLSTEVSQFELIFMRKNGERFPVIVSPVAIKNKKGEIINYAATVQEITKIKETEKLLRQKNEELQLSKNKSEENEERYRILVENAPEALVLFDMQTQKFVNVSKSATALFKLSESKLLASGILEISPEYQPDGRLSSKSAMEKIILASKGEKPFFEWMHKDSFGRLIPCEVTLVRLPYENKLLIRGSISDISKRKEIELELTKSNEKYRNLLANIDAGVVIHAPNTSVVDCNKKGLELLGLSEAQIKGKFAMDPHWKFLDSNNCALALEKYPINQIIKNKQPLHNFVAGVNRPATGDIVWLIVNGFPVFDIKEELTEIIISFIDITAHRKMEMDLSERKRFEIELTKEKEKAEEGEKLKTAFLQNISHEIRTPMNAIIGFSKMLNDAKLSAEERSHFTSIIINNTQQLLSIVTDILTISALDTNQEKVNTNQVNLNKIIIDLLTLFQTQASNLPVSISAHFSLADAESEIFTDKTKLIQILTNLLTNALKFTTNGTVEFGYFVKENELEFYVKDSGIGIEAKQQKKIFERFRQADFSITDKFGGNGLGLSISKGFVELLGGRIWVISKLEEGTTFYFTIPYAPKLEFKEPEAPFKQISNASTILIAEDEGINFLYLKLIFERLHFTVIRAKNGQEAVDICHANPRINVVFMDIKMPILDGYSAAKQIKKFRPDLPIIAQTGYALLNEKEKYEEDAFDDYITKPIDETILFQKFTKYIKLDK